VPEAPSHCFLFVGDPILINSLGEVGSSILVSSAANQIEFKYPPISISTPHTFDSLK
jgi:hypothetical protein